MSVWFVLPSIRPGGGTIPQWRARGYRIGIVRQGELIGADLEIPTESYLGWAASVNILAGKVLAADLAAEWLVSGGDDTLPSDRDPEEIAGECSAHFGGTFGVMQPIGDLRDWPGSWIHKFAGSPWMGRDWCRRAYGGNGPMPGCHFHNFADEELMQVALKLGVFWQRPDLTHRHEHWMRQTGIPKPEFWDTIAAEYHSGRPLYEARKAAGWPGSEPLPC